MDQGLAVGWTLYQALPDTDVIVVTNDDDTDYRPRSQGRYCNRSCLSVRLFPCSLSLTFDLAFYACVGYDHGSQGVKVKDMVRVRKIEQLV